MFQRILSLVAASVFLVQSVFPVQAKTLSLTESKTIEAAGITTVVFRNIEFADIIYRGSPDRSDFEIFLEKRMNNSDEERMGRILSRIYLDTSVSDSTLVVRLFGSKRRGSGILDRWFKRNNWRAILEVNGPTTMNVDVGARFSEVKTFTTSGEISLSTEFSNTKVYDHEGHLYARSGFGNISGEDIRGGFDVHANFGHVVLLLSKLEENSRADISFGEAEIGLPEGAGAVFLNRKSFGEVSFTTSGILTHEEERGNKRVLNEGGPSISLSTEFGKIQVVDNRKRYPRIDIPAYRENVIVPLNRGAWWKYSLDDEIMTLRVTDIRTEQEQTVATLSFDEPVSNPFGSIDVYETRKGLFLSGINQSFMGRNISGITLDPPKIWLPYSTDDSPVRGDEIQGTISIEALSDTVETPDGIMENVITYHIGNGTSMVHRIQLVPGVGFISFDNARLVAYDLSGQAPEEKPEETEPLVPVFEKGVIRGITIDGNYLRKEEYILKKLGIQAGETYTSEEIAAALKRVEKDALIEYASYVVDPEGNLHIRIYEGVSLSRDLRFDMSFTRVAGFGFGPRLRLTSPVAPVSEVNGYARYNWGEEDWAWGANGHRDFFAGNRLRIGGGYRVDFGSNMDWAIPGKDADLNELLLGYESKNYFRIEGSNAFIAQSLGQRFTAQAEFFENKYSSVEKQTNWSLFNRGETKEPNAPLGPLSDRWITGMRYSVDHRNLTTIMDCRSRFEVERSFKNHSNGYPAYTRLLASGSWNMQYWYGHLVKFRLVGGYSPHVLPDQRAFRLGGINTLRGFAPMSIPDVPDGETSFTTQDGGDRVFLMNFDYFYGEEISIIFFGDMGGVWRKGDPVSGAGLKRDLGVGLAFGSDFFSSAEGDEHKAGFRVNWAVPVGKEAHTSRWTVNFVRAY